MTREATKQQTATQSRPLAFDPYASPIPSTRSGAIFRVHPYSTKINHRSIVPFILAHTKPGDVVYDCFAGTCSTGFAAAACAQLDPEVLNRLNPGAAKSVVWGPRRAVCIDLSVLPTFIGRTLMKPVQIGAFEKKFNEVMSELERDWGWIYDALDDLGSLGVIRNTVLSDVIRCSNCESQSRFIDLFVDFRRGRFRSNSDCPTCGASIVAKDAPRTTEMIYDDLLKTERLVVKRVPVTVNGITGTRRWSRPVTEDDRTVLMRISEVTLPSSAKAIPMLSGEPRWGEMYRAGYHQDITHAHHFYTRRNYLALVLLYDAASRFPEPFRNHYLLLVSSYNVAHSSLMTRFVFKKGKNAPVLTSGQPGALYVSGCPVEKNVFRGVRQKLKELCKAVTEVQKWQPQVYVYTRPAQYSGLPDDSIDYIFTDPPFGGNIQYSEINFLSEAWLGAFTESKYETVVSNAQGKKLSDYEELLTAAFRENFRILKPGRYMTVVFHSAKGEVWNSLRRSILKAGFEIVDSSILAKQQTSFKQTTTTGAVMKDPIIVALKPIVNAAPIPVSGLGTPEKFLRNRLAALDADEVEERTFDFLFSRYVGSCLASGQDVLVDASEFKKLLRGIAEQHDGRWFLRGTKNE